MLCYAMLSTNEEFLYQLQSNPIHPYLYSTVCLSHTAGWRINNTPPGRDRFVELHYYSLDGAFSSNRLVGVDACGAPEFFVSHSPLEMIFFYSGALMESCALVELSCFIF